MTSFQDVLGTKVNDLEKPKPRPLGSYYATTTGMPKQKTPQDRLIMEYLFKVTGVKQLDDPELMSGTADMDKWAPMRFGFFVDTPDGQWAHRQFLIHTLGISPDGNKSVGEMVAESVGKACIVTVKHRPFTDANNEAQIATDIASVAKV